MTAIKNSPIEEIRRIAHRMAYEAKHARAASKEQWIEAVTEWAADIIKALESAEGIEHKS